MEKILLFSAARLWYHAAMTEAEFYITPLAFFLFGACIGSFLNVVIYRVPRGLSVNKPRRSFCPHCGAAIPWYRNIPIVSWLLLRGRGACCRKPIAVRYWLVEVACALLFAALAWHLEAEELPTVMLFCAWAALMLASFCIDWEQMTVLPVLTVPATLCAVGACTLSPWLADAVSLEPLEGALLSAGGAVFGFALFAVVALLGKLVFGRRSRTYETAQPWSLRQEGEEDIALRIGSDTLLWSKLFMEESDRLTLTAAQERTHEQAAGEITFTHCAMLLPDGTEVALESVEELGGSCTGYRHCRAAMGSGDAWLAMAIGAACGWQGVIFALVGGSFIGIAQALLARIGRGTPMPFGPALIAAAMLWLFFNEEILAAIATFYGA